MSKKDGGKPRGNGGRFAKGNPGGPGRPRSARADAWQNPHSGYGTTRDRRTATRHQIEIVTDEQAADLWAGNDIAARAIESYPQDALRGGYDVRVGGEQEDATEIVDAVSDLDGDQAVTDALEYERAYGGAAIWPVITGSESDLSRPLDPAKCVAIERLIVLEARELIPAYWYDGEVDVWRVQRFVQGGSSPGGEYLHKSRLVYLPGIRVTKRPMIGHLHGHGHSVLTRMQEVLRDFGISWAAAGAIVHDFSQGVLSIEELTQLLATNGGQGFMDRIAAMDFAKSTMRSMVIDKKDTYVRQSTPVTGLAELLDRFAQRLAAAVAMPVTKLMGMSPAGMNATGDSDARMWYDAVSAFQVDKAQRVVEELLEFVMICREGPTGGEVPEKWAVEWRPLWEPTQAELLEMRKKQAEIDDIYYKMGAIDADEVARNRWPEGGGYSFDTVIDWEERERLEAMQPEPPVPGIAPNGTIPPEDGGETAESSRSGSTKEVGDTTKDLGDTEDVQEAGKPTERTDHAVERDGKWYAVSLEGEPLGGPYDTEAEANERLRQVEAAKAAKGS